jgi:soluble lytic murein transglycosylase
MKQITLLLVLGSFILPCFGEELVSPESVNIGKIIQIESSGNPFAYNKSSQARGLMQITPICLKEYNNYHPKEQYTTKDLFNPDINVKIGTWYIDKRIPQMLRYYNKPVTINNILISYNAGIAYVVKDLPLPTETINYLLKYSIRE